MKKLLILSISLLSLLSLSGCRKKVDNSSLSGDSTSTPTSEVTNSSAVSNSSEPESSESSNKPSSSTSSIDMTGKHVVTFYLNLPGDDSVYRTVIVEDGGIIEKEFRCVVSTYYGSTWFYDRYGTIPFDFKTPINSDLNLYGYIVPKANNVEMTKYEEDGDFNIKWINSQDCSFTLVDGGTLPSKANNGDQIKFKMAYSMFTTEKATIEVNDKVVTPDDNGVYTITVSGDITIKSTIKTSTIVPGKTTYTIDQLPTWITNDGCVIFAWVWGPQVAGEWVSTTYTTDTSLTFTTDKTITGLLLARCAPGTTKPDWNMTTDGLGRVYNQTGDMTVIQGVTTYSLPESMWRPY